MRGSKVYRCFHYEIHFHDTTVNRDVQYNGINVEIKVQVQKNEIDQLPRVNEREQVKNHLESTRE